MTSEFRNHAVTGPLTHTSYTNRVRCVRSPVDERMSVRPRLSGRTGPPEMSACVRLTALQLLSCVRERSCGPKGIGLYSRPGRHMLADPSVRNRCSSELSPKTPMKVSVKVRTSLAHHLAVIVRADAPPCSYCRRPRTFSGLNPTVRCLSSSGRGPSFHLHLYPSKSVRSIGPCMCFICFRYGDAESSQGRI